MKAGSLNRPVQLLRRGPESDNGHELVPGAWQVLGTRLASIGPFERGEGAEGAGLVARPQVSLWLRRDSLTRTLTALDAVAIDGRVFELTGEPIEFDRRNGIKLTAVGGDPVVSI